jgi:DNA repair exonuclease SbcCD ATPase subunit
MIIKDIKITNFKSLYGEHYFNFDDLDGLIKLSGSIGSGKTSLGEAILYGLYGSVKTHKNPNLIAWGTKSCCVEINLVSKGKNINILRDIYQPLKITVDGKLVGASNKRDTQQILEEELFDVPKLAIERMCIISFNQFNSLASMNPGQTKEFLDNVFGFKTFSEYNNVIVNERKNQMTENTRLQTLLNETKSQIEYLLQKKENQKQKLHESIDIDKLKADREELVKKGKQAKSDKEQINKELEEKKTSIISQMSEYALLGKQEKEYYNTFKSGKCPTCGNEIDPSKISESKDKMMEYADKWKALDAEKKVLESEYQVKITEKNNEIQSLKEAIEKIDSQITVYKNNIKLLNENYDNLISDNEIKLKEYEKQLSVSDIEIGEWNEMNELFSKTLRYKLLNSLIPQINKSIQYFINKLELDYVISFDQEFKSHITTENNFKEIQYSDLSTGQRKSVDVAIIFGIIQNIIANVNFNIFFLDELMSNMDAEARNNMLSILKETLSENRTIFVINHAEMQDDFFNHKIRVRLNRKKIMGKTEEIFIKNSTYEKVF